MALFFDQSWFDAELAKRHLSRDNIGAILGLTLDEIAEVWKDQRELKAADVAIIAALLSHTPETIATRAGVSTPAPKTALDVALEARVAALEAKLDSILKKLG